MELHEWSKNVINVENRNIVKVNFGFLLVIWAKWKQSVCSIIRLYSSTFYSLFLLFFVLEIFKFKCNKFFVRHSASISKFQWYIFLKYLVIGAILGMQTEIPQIMGNNTRKVIQSLQLHISHQTGYYSSVKALLE